MPASFTALLAAIALVLVAAGWIFLGGRTRERRLEALRTQRRAEDAQARCLAAFPGRDATNVRAAYRWVQDLVALPDMPLLPQDDLQRTLGIDQGDVDDKFDAARQACGPARGQLPAGRPIETVQALMAAVLAAGWEFFPATDPSITDER